MANSEADGGGGLSSLPRRGWERLSQNFRRDIVGIKQKGKENFPSAVLFLVEKWVAFWVAVIGTALIVGGSGMALVIIARSAGRMPFLANNVAPVINYVGTIGLIVVLTWGVMLFSVLLVSVFRIALWTRDTIVEYWNHRTPPFTTEPLEDETPSWPPSDRERSEAKEMMWDYFGKGAVLFAAISSLLFLADRLASGLLYDLLSSSYITAIGNSIDVATLWIFSFENFIGSIVPGVTQPQLVLFVLFFVVPGAVMAIGARNFQYLLEATVRDHIDEVRDGNYLSWTMARLLVVALYSIGVCVQILAQLG